MVKCLIALLPLERLGAGLATGVSVEPLSPPFSELKKGAKDHWEIAEFRSSWLCCKSRKSMLYRVSTRSGSDGINKTSLITARFPPDPVATAPGTDTPLQ